ncbi:MAG: hydroxymethylpyrimidine/phosphomethylpyrimidine kinase family protein, partial [Actinomycetota bacterium]
AHTAHSTLGVDAVHPVPPAFVVQQLRSAIDDLGVDAVKTGMLGDAAVIEAVAAELERLDHTLLIPVVVDPVLRAESGASLLAETAVRTLRERLAPLASVLTPNLFEAQALAAADTDDAAELARRVHAATGAAVVVTGGHGPLSADVLCADGEVLMLDGPRLDVAHTHGAGCTYAATLATLLGGGMPLAEAAGEAKRTATGAVRAGRSYGAGAGPVDVIRAARG